MLTQEIVLRPTNRPPVAFQGRTVAEAAGPLLDGRHHEITVYETETGELHLVFKYITQCEHEKSQCEVEIAIEADEIQEVLLAYDATECLDRRELRTHYRYEQDFNRFIKRIYGQYDDLCISIEEQLRGYQPSVVAAPQSNEADHSKPSGWRSWIGFRPR